MSLAKNERNLRDEDGKFRAEAGAADVFAAEIARALAAEFGETPSRIKTVARLTRSNEATVKNWFSARNGPSGAGLVTLMRHSDDVLKTVLRLSGREGMLAVVEVVAARERLRSTISTLDQLIGDVP